MGHGPKCILAKGWTCDCECGGLWHKWETALAAAADSALQNQWKRAALKALKSAKPRKNGGPSRATQRAAVVSVISSMVSGLLTDPLVRKDVAQMVSTLDGLTNTSAKQAFSAVGMRLTGNSHFWCELLAAVACESRSCPPSLPGHAARHRRSSCAQWPLARNAHSNLATTARSATGALGLTSTASEAEILAVIASLVCPDPARHEIVIRVAIADLLSSRLPKADLANISVQFPAWKPQSPCPF
jgi:hypothetical protein